MRSNSLIITTLCIIYCVAGPALADSARSGRNTAPLTKGSLQIVLRSGSYGLVDWQDGQKIEMEGFDYLKETGKPLLPESESLFLLPPGARALGLEVESVATERLPGTYKISATPPLLPLSNSADSSEALRRTLTDWREANRAAYASDRAYPEQFARIVGSGTLRQYAYVRVAFYPFTYHAAAGRLVHHSEARIRLHYALPGPASAATRARAGFTHAAVADERASELFVNYQELKELYAAEAGTQPDSRETVDHHDYVIITTPSIVDRVIASGFPGWKSSLGFDVRVVLTNDPEIAGQSGSDLAERIRNFLRAYYGPWGIEYVLLVGGIESIPMRYCYPDPDNHSNDPYYPSTQIGSFPTDLYYADLSFSDAESWDLDGDGFHGEYGQDAPDFLAEVYVGRIPTSDKFRLHYTLQKLMLVEQDSGAWKRNVLHGGAILFYENQDFSGVPFRDGAVCMDEIESNFMPAWTVSRYSEQGGSVPSSFAWPALTQADFIADWSNGSYGIVNWAGHGSPDGAWRVIWMWDDGDGVAETDGSDGIDNEAFIADWLSVDDDHPSIVFAVSCNVGYPEPNASGNLGIDLLTDPGLGSAAAVVSASRYAHVSFDWPALPGGAETNAYEFNRHLIALPGGPRRIGDAHYAAKYFSHIFHGWGHVAEYRNVYDYNLYGDPAMEWLGAGAHRGDLLRNTEISQLQPLSPPLNELLPLDPSADIHVPNFVAGDVDPDAANGSPLVFYAIDGPAWLWLSKTESGEVRIEF